MSTTLQLKLIEQQNPVNNVLVSIQNAPESFSEIAGYTDSLGNVQLPCGSKTGSFTISIFHQNENHIYTINVDDFTKVYTINL